MASSIATAIKWLNELLAPPRSIAYSRKTRIKVVLQTMHIIYLATFSSFVC